MNILNFMSQDFGRSAFQNFLLLESYFSVIYVVMSTVLRLLGRVRLVVLQHSIFLNFPGYIQTPHETVL